MAGAEDMKEVTDINMLPGLDEIDTPMTALADLPPVQALVGELKALHSQRDAPFEPTCLCGERNHADDAACLRALFKCLNYDKDFLDTLVCADSKKAVNAIVCAVNATCNAIKHDIESYQELTVSNPDAGTKALVFYRRHSFALKPHLTADEVQFFDSMCNFLACILRKAGYTVNGPQ